MAIASVQRAGERCAQPSATVSGWIVTTLVRCVGEGHRVRAFGLDADDPGLGATCLHGRCDAADEPAPADTHDDDIDVGHVVDDLEPDRPVAGDHGWIVEWVHERKAFDVADPFHLRERVTDMFAVEDDARAVARQASTFERTASSGMTTVIGTPAAAPAHA